MKIIISTDPEIPVPPELYGGAERIANWLINGLSAQEHCIILVANGESTNENSKLYPWPRNYSRGFLNNTLNSLFLLKIILKEKPDVIYCFSRIIYLYPSFFLIKKQFIKRYGRFISPKSTFIANRIFGKRIQYVALANHMLSHLNKKEKFHVIPNCVDTDFFKDDINIKKTHLLFLGRIEHIKGTYEAIQISLKSNTPLVIAGNIPDDQHEYFKQKVEPYLNHELIHYVGSVNDIQKRDLLQKSIAMLFPINFDREAFGIVLIESLACGTPVIGSNLAAVPEIIINGKNGFVCDTIDEMLMCVDKINMIDRSYVREKAVEKYSIEVIVDQHLQLFSCRKRVDTPKNKLQ